MSICIGRNSCHNDIGLCQKCTISIASLIPALYSIFSVIVSSHGNSKAIAPFTKFIMSMKNRKYSSPRVTEGMKELERKSELHIKYMFKEELTVVITELVQYFPFR